MGNLITDKKMLDAILTEPEILSKGKLQKWQIQALLSKARVRVMAVSRQCGKSVTLRAICLKEMLENPGIEILYLAPTIKQVKAIGFRPMALSNNSIIPSHLIKSINKTELTIELVNGSRIVFAGTEAMDKLRGMTGDLLILDEYALMDADVLTTMEPVVSARNGRIVIAATPIGRNHFFEICEMGRLDSPMFTKGYRTWIKPITDDDVVVPNKEQRIQNAKDTLSPQGFAQEYLVSFSAASGLVYKSYDMDLNRSNQELDRNRKLYVSIDFNIAKMVALVGQRIRKESGLEELHIIDEIVLYDTNTYKMADEIKRRYWSTFTNEIYCIPDASGVAGKTSSIKSDHKILEDVGLKLWTENKNPVIGDRVNCLNAAFCNANGVRKLFIHPRCKELIKSISSQVYDVKTNQPEKGSGSSDISAAPDALGYMTWKVFPIKNQISMGHNL